jgi:glycosyltransferase involved in cell wall biosynthesis
MCYFKVSIGSPTYTQSELISDTIESALTQDYPVLVLENGLR